MGPGEAAAIVTSSDIRAGRARRGKKPFGVGGFEQRRSRGRAHRGPYDQAGFFPEGGYAELASYTSGPGMMNPAAWMLTSQMQTDRYGWGMAPAGSPITPSSAYGPALARGGTGPGRDFGPAYLVTSPFSTYGTPPGNIFQQDVGLRAGEAARVLREKLIQKGFKNVSRVSRRGRGRAYGVSFDATSQAQLGVAETIAADIADANDTVSAALSSYMAEEVKGRRYTIYYTDMPQLAGPKDERIAGFDGVGAAGTGSSAGAGAASDTVARGVAVAAMIVGGGVLAWLATR